MSIQAKYNYDPIESLVAEASSPDVDPDVRRAIHLSLAPYFYPKHKSLEFSGDSSLLHKFQEFSGVSEEELSRRFVQSLSDEQICSLVDHDSRFLGLVPDHWLEEQARRILPAS